jgi:hypothetical protein
MTDTRGTFVKMFLLCMSVHFLPALSRCADADLPGKASLADRRAKYDAIKARQQAQLAALDEAAARSRRQPEMDEMYLEAKQRSMVRIFGFFVRKYSQQVQALPDSLLCGHSCVVQNEISRFSKL